jgi:hypothetical protein
MFRKYFRNKKIKKYAKLLPRDLVKNYGRKEYYSKYQVDLAVIRKRLGYSPKINILSNSIVYAMYCSPEEFQEIHETAKVSAEYSEIRREIVDIVFDKVVDLSFDILLSETPELSTQNLSSSDFSDSSFGGGDFGGDGGGGE